MADIVHTNTVEGYYAILKRGIIGTYDSVSEAHLHRYLAEFDFRYSNRWSRMRRRDEGRARVKWYRWQTSDLSSVTW